jgi:hypothetical protein
MSIVSTLVVSLLAERTLLFSYCWMHIFVKGIFMPDHDITSFFIYL